LRQAPWGSRPDIFLSFFFFCNWTLVVIVFT
jgi:hypothetical protein